MISVEKASLVYHDHGKDVFACRQIDLQVGSGEFLGILGPSGSGKSSLLYLMCGLKLPTEGSIKFEGRDIPQMSDHERAGLRLDTFGFVFQHPFLIGYLSALENIVAASPFIDRRDEAEDLLDQLGLGEKRHRLPHELSGGERQRVCVARALLGTKQVIFCDEPTAALDHKTGLKVMETLSHHRRGGSLIVVTHDPSMLEGADRIVRINDGEIEA